MDTQGSEVYRLTIEGFGEERFRVHAFSGRERMSEVYSFTITVSAEAGADEDIERAALGRSARFVWLVGGVERAFYGIIASVKARGVHETREALSFELRFAPRMWLLKRRKRTRIFQNMRVHEIASAVLSEMRIGARFQLVREHPPREYCTQYEETDEAFIRRILAEAGIAFTFATGPTIDEALLAGAKSVSVPGDTILGYDDASFYPPLGGDDVKAGAAPTLHYQRALETSGSYAEKVMHFGVRAEVRSTSATYSDYDPERPLARLTRSAASHQPFAEPTEDEAKKGPGALELYEHHGPFLFPKWAYAADEAPLMLKQDRRRALLAEGESGAHAMSPGHRFSLDEHPSAHHNRAYVITEVTHHGESRPSAGDKEARVYKNHFACVPAEVTFVPKRPKRKSVQVALTATVVGPAGEEIYTDALGQIKVQFHWDREGGYTDKSSCWIRTMHPWAGAGWGAQFIPRVGMEVVVVFEGGDPDKPMVLGALYNGTHPPPFMLPHNKTRSGLRTQSTPGGGGFNELSFEDATANEQIYLHAQRDLDEVVERDHTLLVRGAERIHINGSRSDGVDGDARGLVKGNDDEHVMGNQSRRVDGDRIDVVTGNSDERVSGALTSRVEGRERRDVTGQTDHEYADDLTVRVKGCYTTLVGKHDQKRSYLVHAEGSAKLSSLDSTEVSSEKELVLRVGKSMIRITEDAIELVSQSITVKGAGAGMSVAEEGLNLSSKGDAELLVDKKILIKTKDASLAMEKEVKIDGKQILLNSPEQAKDPKPKDPDPPTNVELVDDEGAPLAYQRFLITLDDGTEISGVTDKDGKSELLNVQGDGKVTFPDLSEAEAG